MRDTRTFTSACASAALVAFVFFLSSELSAQAGRPVSRPISRPRIISADDVVKIGISLDVGYFTDFSKLVADQPNLTTSDASDIALGGGASLELSPMGPRPFFARVNVNFGIQNFEQTYNSPSPADPVSAKGRVNALVVDGQLGLRLLKGQSTVFTVTSGPSWMLHDAGIDFVYASDTTKVNRVENGWKMNIGANLWRSLDERLGFQLGVTYTSSFKKPDADQNWRLSTGLTLGLGGGGF